MADLKHPPEIYTSYNPFFGEEADITCRNVKLVKVRKPHTCLYGCGNGDGHIIAPGDYARYETALVDGSYWGRYYICIPCLDKEMAELNGDEDDDD